MQLSPFASSTGYPLDNESSTSRVYSFTRHQLIRSAHTGRRHANMLVAARLHQKQPRSTMGGAAIRRPRVLCHHASAWNRLSTELKVMRSSTTTFKHHLKTFHISRHSLYMASCITQLAKRRSLPANWPCPALGLNLTGDHYVGKPSTTGQPTRPTQPFILRGW